MSRVVPVSVLILAGALSVAQADVFRWVDEHGEPHYSDQWVPGSQIIKTSKAHPGSETLGQPVAQRTVAASNAKVGAQLDNEANSRAVQQDVDRVRDAQCKAATERYKKAIESRRVYKEEQERRAGIPLGHRCGRVPRGRPQGRPGSLRQACRRSIRETPPIPEPQADPGAQGQPGRRHLRVTVRAAWRGSHDFRASSPRSIVAPAVPCSGREARIHARRFCRARRHGQHMARNLHRAGLLGGLFNRTAAKAQALAAELKRHRLPDASGPRRRRRRRRLCVSADADVLEVARALAPGAAPRRAGHRLLHRRCGHRALGRGSCWPAGVEFIDAR